MLFIDIGSDFENSSFKNFGFKLQKMIELYETVEKNEYDYLRKLMIMRGVEKTLPQKRKNLLLQLSAELGHPCCCEILLKGSASVDCINDYKETPLHLSA